MAFTLSGEERRRFDHLLSRGAGSSDAWKQNYWDAVESGRTEGWYCPDAFELVRSSGAHEIASHSFCHRPLGPQTSHKIADAELTAAGEAAALKRVPLSTFVFPRNDVGNLAAVEKHGYLGYRERLRRPRGPLGRLLSLTNELDVLARPQPEKPADEGMIAIPAGYVLNWRFGARRRVPKSVTITRWSRLLERTAHDGGLAHLWLHPHNLITAPSTGEVLKQVLDKVAEMQARGSLKVETQEQYCRRLRARETLANAVA